MTVSGHKTLAVFERYNIVSQEDMREAAQKRTQTVKRMMGTILGTIEGAEELVKSLTP